MIRELILTIMTAVMFFAFPCSVFGEEFNDALSSDQAAIPVMNITIGEQDDLSADQVIYQLNSSPDHSFKAKSGSVSITLPDGYTYTAEGIKPETIENLAFKNIRGRGNSTWHPWSEEDIYKNPYRIKFKDPQALFSCDAESDTWILLSNAFDSSLVKNRLTGYLGKQLGLGFTPQSIPVDLFINGSYYGSYTLAEDVGIKPSGCINLQRLTETDTNQETITGPYLLAMHTKMNDISTFTTRQENVFTNLEPNFNPDDDGYENEAQMNYIRGYMQDIEDLLYADDFTEAGSESYRALSELMDLKSAADYWWVQEFSKNPDGFNTTSNYLYKEENGKLCWGPLWDFDQAWGYNESDVTGFNNTCTPWFDRLRSNPDFVELLKSEWTQMDKILETMTSETEGTLFSNYGSEMPASWNANFDFWKSQEYSYYDPYSDLVPGKQGLADLKAFIDGRRAWVNDNLNEAGHVYTTYTFIADGKVIGTRQAYFNGSVDEEAPEIPDKEGFFPAGWFTEDGTAFDDDTPTDKDLTFYAKYVPESSVSQATGIEFQGDYLCVRPETDEMETSLRYVVVPETAEDKRVSWTSSNEDILKPLGNGRFKCAGTGEVTVTAVLKGSKASRTVTVYVFGKDGEIPAYDSFSYTDSLELKTGETGMITFRPDPVKSDFFIDNEFDFTTDNEDVVSLHVNGLVTARKPGSAVISIEIIQKTDSGEYIPAITRTCSVKVTGDIETAAVSGIKAKIYTGKKIRQNIKVTAAGTKLKKGTDYTVAYKNNVNAGTATVIITGKGLYTGSLTRKFTIRPKGTSITRLSKKNKALTVKWKKQTAKMKRQHISGYQIMLATDKNFKNNKRVITVGQYKKNAKLIKRLKGGKKYYVKIRTFMKRGGNTYNSSWSKVRRSS